MNNPRRATALRIFIANQISVYRAVACTKKEHVIASQSSDWRGNPHRFQATLRKLDGGRHTSVRTGSR